ncbi:isochorismate synthase [Gordonia iterans]|uniref:isochorismate synthase n=1 Tax=Gordonia iterans TaxID=1004901 RepID=A0A2S0KEW9_9ACTN|nr:isochorismate synthase [Gordonia iterans]AVM00196.1 isochorismate synthase [Gordonia iterans]
MSTTTHRTDGEPLAGDIPAPRERPGFLLCRNDYRVRGHGWTQRFDDASAAADALRAGTVDAVVGALPFDVRDRSALIAPHVLQVHDGPWTPVAHSPMPPVRVDALNPPIDVHRRRVAAAVAALGEPGAQLAKVVLARSIVLRGDRRIDPWNLAAALRTGDPHGSVFVADLAPSGRASTLVGASPEVLVRKRGRTVSCRPLAGSAARSTDPAVDAQRRRTLAASAKDRAEHRFVVEAIADALSPFCRTLEVPAAPEVMATPAMWHLGTPIRGELADSASSALDLALTVHPTPAICGTPTAQARDHILSTEEPRGFYAGAVGWARAGVDGGDGEWMVAIRCAEVHADGRSARTWAGGGIVAASDPDDEVAETEAKLATVLRAMGIDSGDV